MSSKSRYRASKKVIAGAMATAVAGGAIASSAGALPTVNLVRVFGADRYATSRAITTAMAGLPGGAPTSFVLVNGASFPDALAASALAGSVNGTVLLVPPSGDLGAVATAGTAANLIAAAGAGANVAIVGGPVALPTTLEAAVTTANPAVTLASGQLVRIQGATRYETAIEVGTVASAPLGANISPFRGATRRTAIIASGENFADAVVAAPAAFAGLDGPLGSQILPIFLTPSSSVAPGLIARLQTLGVTQVIMMGGPVAINASVEAAFTAASITVIRVQGADRYATAAEFANLLTTPVLAGGFGWMRDDLGLVNLEPQFGGADALSASGYLGRAMAPALGITSNGAPAPTIQFATASASTAATVHAFGGQLVAPDSVVNSVRVAAGHQAGPEVSSATRAVVMTSAIRTLVEGSAVVSVTSKVPGVPGNAITVALDIDAANPATPTAVVTGTAANPIVTIRAQSGATAAAVAAAIAADPSANALVSAQALGATSSTFTADIAGAALTGGSEVVRIIVTFNRAVTPASLQEANISYDPDGAGATAAIPLNTAGVTETFSAGNTVLTIEVPVTSAAVRPTAAATLTFMAGSITDANATPRPIDMTVRVLTAAS